MLAVLPLLFFLGLGRTAGLAKRRGQLQARATSGVNTGRRRGIVR